METVSLILIAIGLVIIAVVFVARLRIKHGHEARRDNFRQPFGDAPHGEAQDYDPLFAIDNAQAERRELDKLGAMLAKQDDPVLEDAAPPQAKAAGAPPVQSAPSPSPAQNVAPPSVQNAPPLSPQNTPPRVAKPARRPPRLAEVPEQVVTLNVMAPEGQRFTGPLIAAAAERAGLELGAWSIYHYYSRQAPDAPPMFSVANMVKPGNFDPAHMDEMSTVGLSMFMVPAMDGGDMASFDMLLSTARQLAGDLGGEVRDARRSLLTRQATERMREEIIEWRRKAQLAHS